MRGCALGIALLLALAACGAGRSAASHGARQAGKAPQLVSPEAGVLLSQPTEGWTFTWKAPEGQPEPKEYQIQIGVQGTRRPLVDTIVDKTTFAYKQQKPVPTGGTASWVWKVRAHYGPGQYGPWSEERPFKVEMAKAPPPAAPPAGGASGQPQPPAADARALVAAGAKVYDATGCARCHSIRGRGGRSGPDLTRVARNPKHTPDWLAEQVANPQAHNPASRMPAFGQQLQEGDLQALAAYLASLK